MSRDIDDVGVLPEDVAGRLVIVVPLVDVTLIVGRVDHVLPAGKTGEGVRPRAIRVLVEGEPEVFISGLQADLDVRKSSPGRVGDRSGDLPALREREVLVARVRAANVDEGGKIPRGIQKDRIVVIPLVYVPSVVVGLHEVPAGRKTRDLVVAARRPFGRSCTRCHLGRRRRRTRRRAPRTRWSPCRRSSCRERARKLMFVRVGVVARFSSVAPTPSQLPGATMLLYHSST